MWLSSYSTKKIGLVFYSCDIPVGIDGRQSYSVKGDASHYTPVAGSRTVA